VSTTFEYFPLEFLFDEIPNAHREIKAEASNKSMSKNNSNSLILLSPSQAIGLEQIRVNAA